MTGPDYRIDGLEPASDLVEEDFHTATLSDDMYTELASHHTKGNTFLLLYDSTAVWGVPGTAEYVGMRVQRDLFEGTFAFEHIRQPTVPITQNWLISRGCPPDAIELGAAPGPRPTDGLTSRLEDMLRANLGGRYTLLDHYTHNPCSFNEGVEVSALVHDGHPDSAERPYRLFLEETSPSLATYTVREGAFAGAEAADAWLRDRDTPLPLAPTPAPAPAPASNTVDRRAAAALIRTTTSATASTQLPLPGVTAAPDTGLARSRGLS
ncbi:hypothetical protein OHB04_39025 [Streptomyces sp. NBC_01775]|uniref:hypothetical protein n=1 Tax=Streptomyces sp. NBC_01775 TaxID=2975939 RepID=UPI002DDBE62F|nr:hypothetical protein [Streptomyces sp. NBC_01775]WSB81102.1 hypothetical protein OHB04_39025 [Streptomyces sp. NBC_01775]